MRGPVGKGMKGAAGRVIDGPRQMAASRASAQIRRVRRAQMAPRGQSDPEFRCRSGMGRRGFRGGVGRDFAGRATTRGQTGSNRARRHAAAGGCRRAGGSRRGPCGAHRARTAAPRHAASGAPPGGGQQPDPWQHGFCPCPGIARSTRIDAARRRGCASGRTAGPRHHRPGRCPRRPRTTRGERHAGNPSTRSRPHPWGRNPRRTRRRSKRYGARPCRSAAARARHRP